MTQLCDLRGAWRRSLIIEATGSRDDTTKVAWLQGASVYVDLRQPRTHISFSSVKALRDLDAAQAEELARQEGFAGTLIQHSDHFEWTRSIDFQPPLEHGDRGILEDLGHMMIEKGYNVPYIEHWRRSTNEKVQAGALELRDLASGCPGMILRVGDIFAFARGRVDALRGPGKLIDFVRKAPTLEKAQTLIDCEISTGAAVSDWRIECSTLPYRVSAGLAPQRAGNFLMTGDVTPDGMPYQRNWTIIAQEGSFSTDL